MARPRIALPEINQNVTNYIKAVTATGMEPVVITVKNEQALENNPWECMDFRDFRAASFDGLLLPGGGDINPSRYHQESRGSYPPNDDLDELQLNVLDDFVKAGKPILGICRGFQLINVYFGGTLIQDLDGKDIHTATKETGDRVHVSLAKKGSWISMLYGTEFAHNSAHHQAIDVCGDGIGIVSWCKEDDVPEALQHSRPEIFGVQWHPERMCLEKARTDTVCGLEIFRHLCRICGVSPDSSAF